VFVIYAPNEAGQTEFLGLLQPAPQLHGVDRHFLVVL
jgi:hypothetical protein